MKKQPNFIFILADDLGYADLGCYGARADNSPNIDRMAAQGLKFTNGYANSPVCSPTRFALATGRYQYRLRGAAEEPIAGRNGYRFDIGLPPEHPTMASLLRDAGYKTALIGKWHMGFAPNFGPQLSGYDTHFGLMSGGIDYFSHVGMDGVRDMWENGQPSDAQGYLTDVLSKRAVDFVAQCAGQEKPFLLSLHYTAPHWPWETRDDAEVSKELAGRIPHLDGGSVQTYGRMIHHMDEGIGKLLAELDRCGLADNTVVVFTSDNGGERFSDSWPLVGGKMDLTEGGIRVPYVVRWPALIPPATTSQNFVMTMDWTPTFLDAAGVAPDQHYPLDGVSLMPVLTDPGHARDDRQLFWRMKYQGQRAMREGNWKYLAVDGREYLFNLAVDERERANQAKREPQRLQAMRLAYDTWHTTMPPIPLDAEVKLIYGLDEMPAR